MPLPCVILKAQRLDMWSGPVGLLNLAHRSGSNTPGSLGGHAGEDIAPSVCGIGELEVRRQDMRSGPLRLLRVSLAAPVLGCLGAEQVTERRTLPPPCVVLEARLHAPAEWASGVSRNLARRSGTVPPGSQRESREEGRASPRSYSSSLYWGLQSGAPAYGRYWSATPVALAREAETRKRGSAVQHWTCRSGRSSR